MDLLPLVGRLKYLSVLDDYVASIPQHPARVRVGHQSKFIAVAEILEEEQTTQSGLELHFSLRQASI